MCIVINPVLHLSLTNKKKKTLLSSITYLLEKIIFPFPEGVIRCRRYCTKGTHNKLRTSLVKLMYTAIPCEEDCIFKLKCVFIQDVCSMKQCRVEHIIVARANSELVCRHLILNRRFVFLFFFLTSNNQICKFKGKFVPQCERSRPRMLTKYL